MIEFNENLLDSKIKEYTNIFPSSYAHIVDNSENDSVYNDSIFNLNNSSDIAMSLHNNSANNKLHKHDFFELIYVYNGQCNQVIDNKQMILKEGQLCFLNTKATHSIATEDHNNIIFNFLFKKSFFSRHFLNLINENNDLSSFLINYLFDDTSKQTYLVLNSLKIATIKTILLNIINEFISKNLGFRSVIESLYVMLFIEIARNDYSSEKKIISKDKKYANVNEIISYIEDNYASTSLNKTAEHFHYHPAYLSRSIKNATNKTYSELLKEIRFREATFYLTNTNMPVKQIIKSIGYNELSHFHVIFKKEFNMTPNEYRTVFKDKK